MIREMNDAHVVYGAVRELYGVRIGEQFVVYDSYCVDAPAHLCFSIAPADPSNATELDRALLTGSPYGRQVLRARVECGGWEPSEITTTGTETDMGLVCQALIRFSHTSSQAKELSLFADLYRHLTGLLLSSEIAERSSTNTTKE